MKNFIKPLVLVSIFKIVMGFFFVSADTAKWFIPFVDHFITHFDNPWEYFYNQGENRIFPYGPVMLYPLAIMATILSPLKFILGSENLILFAFTGIVNG